MDHIINIRIIQLNVDTWLFICIQVQKRECVWRQDGIAKSLPQLKYNNLFCLQEFPVRSNFHVQGDLYIH